MKKKILLSMLGLLLIASLVACAAPTPAPAPAPAPAPTQMPTKLDINLSSQQEGIWVSGTGEVTVTPDIAILRLGIVAQEASVAEAQTKASEAMNKVITALTESGVAEEDIQTQYFNIRQRTKWDRETEEEIVIGYQVTNTVVAKIRVLDIESYPLDYKAGIIINAVAEAGGDLTRIESIGFSIDDPSVYYEEAREKAMADAKAKAEQLAELAGTTLGKPTYVSESVHIPPIYKGIAYEYEMAGGPMPVPAPAPPPSISPGEMKVRLTVQVAYSILP